MSKIDSGNGLRETEIDSGHFPKLLEFTPAECERLERRSAHPGPKKKKLSAAGWAKTESSLSCVGDPRLKGPRLKHLCVHVAGQTFLHTGCAGHNGHSRAPTARAPLRTCGESLMRPINQIWLARSSCGSKFLWSALFLCGEGWRPEAFASSPSTRRRRSAPRSGWRR